MVFGNVPTPDQDSGSLRMFMILKSLAQIGRPIFVSMNRLTGSEYERELGQHGVELMSRWQYREALAGNGLTIVILSRIQVANEMFQLIRRVNKEIPIIFDSVDIESLRLEREAALTCDDKLRKKAHSCKKQELIVAGESDQIWAVSDADKAIIEKDLPNAIINVIPNIHSLQERGKAFEERQGLLFVGSFWHSPNSDAIEYFVRSIYPQVSRALPNLKAYIAGSHMGEDLLAYQTETIRCLGFVPDLGDLFKSSRLFIAPLRFGSGLKGKIGQALSYGLPVITTTVGAEGFGFHNGVEAIIADSPLEFSQALIAAYSNKELWEKLSENGYQYVEQNLSAARVHEKIVSAINLLIP